MANLRRPTREFSFSNHQRLQPNAAPPGNELDGMLHDLREAIVSTQEALAELRRDDGQLRNNLVGPDQLRSDLRGTLIGDIAKVTDALTNQVRDAIASQTITIHDVNLLAKDAEAAAISAQQWLAQVKQIESHLVEVTTRTEVTSQAIATTVTDTENWYNYSKAQADNAIKAKEEALAWAEFLAGPVVSGPDAPAYISQSAWPHGLFYQPIDGAGGLGGLWSAKWWAVRAQQIVGWMTSLYLGAWDHPPMPGEVNPDTGQVVPNPIPPGSMYFNTTNNKLYVWTGEIWVTPFSLTGGVTSRFAYKATAGQTVFSGVDLFGNEPETEDDTEHDVHVNGVKLSRDYGTGVGDYTVNNTTATLTLLFPVTADSIVQWDILVSADDLRPGAAVIFKIDPIPVDGITMTFTLTYMSGTMSPYITKPVELLVFVDGVAQEPYVDFTAINDTITFFSPPGATSRVWMEYFRSGDLTALVADVPPAPVIVLSENRVPENAAVNTTVGTLSMINPHTGSPVYTLTDDAGGKFKVVGNAIQVAGALDFETAVSHSITIQATGVTPAAAPRTLSIVVLDVPEGIIGDIVLVGSSVAEDAIIGMTIGTLSVLNVTGTPTFSLLNDAGGKFFVSGASLRVAAPLPGPGTYLIVVAVTGVLPETAAEAFVITVTPAAGAGVINLTGSSIPESATPGTTVGTLNVTGTSGTPVYTLVENPGGKFAINSGNLLQVAGTLDFETQPTIVITVAVGGVSPPAPAKEFTIHITYVDTLAPTITSASTVSNAENTVLAHALTADEAISTWAIVGGVDQTRFEISGSTLRWLSNGTKDFELPNDSDANNQYIVQVRAADPAGNVSSTQTITVTVTDVFEVSWADFAGGSNTNMTISDANLGLRIASAVNAMAVASAHWKHTGKRYFEVSVPDSGANGDHIGLAIEGATIAQIGASADPVYGFFGIGTGSGAFFVAGYSSLGANNLGQLATGDVVCFAVDLDNGVFWARKSTGNWDNDATHNPATGVGGFAMDYVSQARVAPMGYCIASSFIGGSKWLFNFGQNAFVAAVPAGFEAGWSAGAETAIGHPTWGRLQTIATNYGANVSTYIEKGERFFGKVVNTGGNEVVHVGLNNFKLDGAGKFYVEFFGYQFSGNAQFGIMTGDAAAGTVASSFQSASLVKTDGPIWSNDVNTGLTLGAIGSLSVSMAVDRVNRKVWFRYNGGNWNGQAIGLQDPANNIGGVSISNYNAKTMGPFMGTGNSFAGQRVVINTGHRPFKFSVPSGFTAGWPIAPLDVTGPVFSSATAVANKEYELLAHTLVTNETATFTLVGGADQARFELSGSTLRWLSNGTKTFASPNDADLNNTYIVTVRAADLFGNTTDQTITVTVSAQTWADFAGGTIANTTLSDGNLGIAPSSGVFVVAVASTAYKKSGKYYFECVRTDAGANGELMGVIAQGYDFNRVTNAAGEVGHCIGITAGGGMIGRGSPSWAALTAFAEGERVSLAVDLDNWRFWARKQGGNWNNNASANPATNVGGMDISYLNSTVLAPFGMFHQNSFTFTAKWNYNFGQAAFTYAVPAGFMPGWPTGNHTATGHPTYAHLTYIDAPTTAGWIEPGGQLFAKPGSATVTVRPDLSQFRNTGQYYVEFEWASAPTSGADGPGFMCHDALPGDVSYILSSAGAAVAKNGAIWSNDVDTGLTIGARAAGDIIGAAIDFTNKKVWFRVAPSGNWNGQAIGSQNPASNIGGASISLYAAKAMGPIISSYSYPGPINLLNLGERTFSGAVPAGFTSGWPKVADPGPPTMTSATSVSNGEGVLLAHTLTANQFATFAIVGGTDQAKFEISGQTLRWLANGAKDFEAPDDSDANNTYQVIVRATNLFGGVSSDQTITVTVTDVTFEVVWRGSAIDATAKTTYTYTGVPIGPADANRRVIVGTTAYGGNWVPVASMTVNGIAAERASSFQYVSTSEVWFVQEPSAATTATIVVTFVSGHTASSIGVWTVNSDLAVVGRGGVVTSTTANASNGPINSAFPGFLVACGQGQGGTFTVRNMVTDATLTSGAANIKYAHTSTGAGPTTVGMDGAGGTSSHWMAVAFTPRGAAGPLDATPPSGAWSMSRSLLSRYAGPSYELTSGAISEIIQQQVAISVTCRNAEPGRCGNLSDYNVVAQRPALTTYGVNSRAAADFDGTDDYLTGWTDSVIMTTTTLYAVVVASFDTANFALNASNPNAGNALFSNAAAYYGVFGNDSAGAKRVYGTVHDGAARSPAFSTLPLNTVQVYALRHEGGLLYISINGGAEVSVACGARPNVTNLFRVGWSIAANGKFDGKLLEYAVWGTTGNPIPNSTQRAAIIAELKTYHGIP
jgi:hypothetical protein